MIYRALLYMVIANSFIGIMSQLRKSYQIRHGAGFITTLMFSMLISVFGAIGGMLTGTHLEFQVLSFTLSFCYAILTTVTASLCICGTAFGNISVLILYATLGSLVIPSVYGIISQPDKNTLSWIKIIGYLLAFFCLVLNFLDTKKANKEKSSKLFKLFCMIVFFTNGSALIVYNLENRFCSDYPYFSFITEYMLISAIISAVIITVVLLLKKAPVKESVIPVFNVKTLIIVIGYAVLFFIAEFLGIKCAGMIPLIIQAPISFCIPIVVTAILDYILYRERLNIKNVFQIIAALLCATCFIFG